MDYSIALKIALDCFKRDTPLELKCDVLTVAGDNSRSVLYDGKYYSPLIDTIEDDLRLRGVSCLSVARIISTIRDELSYGKVYAPDGSFARALVMKRIKGIFKGKRYPFSRAEEGVWGRILDRTNARKVVGIQPSRELCVACRKRGIWVADVQHGVIAEMHPWYGERFRGGEPPEYSPHAFLCWDRGAARVIEKWALRKGVATHVIGNHWLARFQRGDADDRLVRTLSERFRAEGGESSKKTILVSLTWNDRNIPNGLMNDGLLEAIRASSREYRWFIRLHPNQVKGFKKDEGRRFVRLYKKHLAGQAEWELPTLSALPVVLKHVDVHISWDSSVCIDAAQMGIRSALLNPKFRTDPLFSEYFSYQVETGTVDLIEEGKMSILRWIERNLDTKRPPEVLESSRRAYRELIQFLST